MRQLWGKIVVKLQTSNNVIWHDPTVTRSHRELQNGHRGKLIWLTGLSGAGKSTLAHAIEEALYQQGCKTFVLDGDNVRHGLCRDLNFSAADRRENIRRVGEVAKFFVEAGVVVLAAFVSPYRADREFVRTMFCSSDFIEVYCDASIETCEMRDTKGMYKKARTGEIVGFTGISSPYEIPENPEIIVNTGTLTLDVCMKQVVDKIVAHGLFSAK